MIPVSKFYTETKMQKRILVVTNDSTVFKDKRRLFSAYEMFEGRVTEVKNLVARLDTAVGDDGKKLCDVSFGIISARYGFVPANYMVTGYDEVMDSKEAYEDLEERKQFVEQVSYLTQPFDLSVICVPKDMFAMFLAKGELPEGKIVAVTCPEFKDECEKRGWTFLERRGARVGNENADEIERIVRKICAE